MPDIQIPGLVITILKIVLAFAGAFSVALWLSLIVWTFRDARSRSRDAFAILLATLMTVIFGPLGLLLYFLLRPQVTLAELYERSLEEEALLQDLEERARCAGCSRVVDEAWIVCPDCHTQLKRLCQKCGQGMHLRWNICPHCAAPVNQAGLGSQSYATAPKDPTIASVPQSVPASKPDVAEKTKPVSPPETFQPIEEAEGELISKDEPV